MLRVPHLTREVHLISNYYILHAVVSEIHERLIGAGFLRAYSTLPGELRIEFDAGEIVAAFQPAHTTLYIAEKNHRETKKNVLYFFKELEGLQIISISIAPDDKLVQID